jgi:nifR3 family TIM-barrel protein
MPQSMPTSASLASLFVAHPVLLAPMEDVSDATYRRVCRSLGAVVCVTEFVRAEHAIGDAAVARRKMLLAPDDQPTAIQIYGSDPTLLLEAAQVAERAGPAFIDINCGCWVPRVAARGAGAAWLRDPDAMVAMAQRVVAAVNLPVTVKTRIGWGGESNMPIVDLARRLEDVGVAALTIHCRTAQMGHAGPADWSWAERAQGAVSIPVVVNGDVRTATDVVRALRETGCAAVMIGRAAIEHPWIFREARALLDAGHASEVRDANVAMVSRVTPPSVAERVELYRHVLAANIEARGAKYGVEVTRRHFGFLGPALRVRLRKPLCAATTWDAVTAVLDSALELADARAAESCSGSYRRMRSGA